MTYNAPLTLTPDEALTLAAYLQRVGEAGRTVAVATEADGLHLQTGTPTAGGWSSAFGAHTPEPTDHLGSTMAERRVLAALSPREPRTPAELKRRMPKGANVDTVRELLGRLAGRGLAQPAPVPGAAGKTVAWVSVGAGVVGSKAARDASLEATKAEVTR